MHGGEALASPDRPDLTPQGGCARLIIGQPAAAKAASTGISDHYIFFKKIKLNLRIRV